jgi:benzoyl-CoA-dihydrodiol lyase
MRDTQDGEGRSTMTLSKMNFGPQPMVNKLSRLAARFYGDEAQIDTLRAAIGKTLSAREALEVGLVTAAPDDLDWEDEIRQAIESRAAQSPDALTGLEANLRFGPTETMATRIFGRLSAWQNWIFIRPNAVGSSGALKVYGTGAPVKFNWERV